MKYFNLALIFLISFSSQVIASEGEPDYFKKKFEWVEHKPYVPEVYDYYVELGAMWEERNLYWLGGGFGRHIGRCIFTQSQSCQQYWDIFGGVGGRDGLTGLLFLTGPRWQFVNFPSHISPSVRVFAGIMNIRDDIRDVEIGAVGIGVGQTMAVHDRIDVRLEARAGYAEEVWYQTTAAIHLKMDSWVDYFASKLKDFGIEAVKTPGRVMEKTGEAIQETFSSDKKIKD